MSGRYSGRRPLTKPAWFDDGFEDVCRDVEHSISLMKRVLLALIAGLIAVLATAGLHVTFASSDEDGTEGPPT